MKRLTRNQKRTYAGKRPSTGACATCVGVRPFVDAAIDAATGDCPLCISETGRLAHFCDEHRPVMFRVCE